MTCKASPWRTTLPYACEIGKYRFGDVSTRIAAAVQKVRLVMQWWPVQLPSWFWTAMSLSLAVGNQVAQSLPLYAASFR